LSEYEGDISIIFEGQEENAKDFLNIIKLGIEYDDEFVLKISGENPHVVLNEIKEVGTSNNIIKVL
jgi:phosphotransferase system HPr-like phosphotransfer protein